MDNSDPAQPRRRARRGLEIALFLLVVFIAAVLAMGTMRLRHAQKERAAVHRLWRLGALVLFERGTGYTNPSIPPDEWDAELRRSWLDDLAASEPTQIMFAYSRIVGWPALINDDAIPELINVLRVLPTITHVRLDATKITPAGHARLKNALPAVRFHMPPRTP